MTEFVETQLLIAMMGEDPDQARRIAQEMTHNERRSLECILDALSAILNEFCAACNRPIPREERHLVVTDFDVRPYHRHCPPSDD